MKFLLRKALFLIISSATLVSYQAAAQHPIFNPIPTPEWIEQHKDSLREALLANKFAPDEFELPILAALMYYPDLGRTNITFKTRTIATSMAALPTVGSIFYKRNKRRYSIIINNKINSRRAPLLNDVPFEARVGVIGHELAHIVDYRNKNFFHIISNGISYTISTRFKRNLEHKVDRININRGLGNGLYAFRLFIEKDETITLRYKIFKESVYMSSAEIAKMIENLDNLARED